jgi:peptide/nickel transport system substrate-binding protein
VLQVLHDNATGDAGFSARYKHACDGNTATLCDPRMDKLIFDAEQAMGDERFKLFQEVARASYEDYVDNVYLVHMVGFARVGPRIKYVPNVLTNGMLRIEDITFN